MELIEKAKAKINLAIDVTGVRADGYHQVDMVMGALALHDSVRMRPSSHIDATDVLEIEGSGLGVGLLRKELFENNLIIRAYNCFANSMPERNKIGNYRFKLNKSIPVAAGLGGGSSDAAAVLRALRRQHGGCSLENLMQMAASLGSDIPFFIEGGIVRATGRGEILEHLAVDFETEIILIKPDFSLSTGKVYQNLNLKVVEQHPDIDLLIAGLARGDRSAIAAGAVNVLEIPAFALQPELIQIKESMRESGAWLAMMSGSGPTIFGFFAADNVKYAQELLQMRYPSYDVIRTKFDFTRETM